MAAYGALSSLLLTLDNFLDHNNSNNHLRVALDRGRLESLRERANFLRQCLVNSSAKIKNDEMESLEAKIRGVAFRAEDLIANTTYEDPPLVSPMWFCLQTLLCISGCVLLRFHRILFTLIKVLSILCVLGMGILPTLFKYLKDALITLFASTIGFALYWIVDFCSSLRLYIKKLANLLKSRSEDQAVLSKILDDIEAIVEKATAIGTGAKDVPLPLRYLTTAVSTSRCDICSIRKNALMVGMEGDLKKIKASLEDCSSPQLKIIPIVGMGGIGKTTLATQVYNDRDIRQQFDICAWATVSKENSFHFVVLELLNSMELQKIQEKSDDAELGDYLNKCLYGKKYLIVIDDVWDIEIWNVMRRFLPLESKGSRVLLTTRFSEVVCCASYFNPLRRLRSLDDNESQRLLHECVFGEEDCPRELREIQYKIAQSCEGYPLALVVIGGLLSKAVKTTENWRRFADSLKSATNKDGNKFMEILASGYYHLPHHLKPCFLYMGMFPQDYTIRASKLIQLWAAEGFLQPNSSKSMEELGEKYLKELVERNLIMVSCWSSQGKIKRCKIHDVLRELCLLQALKEKFLFAINRQEDFFEASIESYRMLSIHHNVLKIYPDILSSKNHLTSRAHSLISIGTEQASLRHDYLHYKLLKVLDLLAICFNKFPQPITEVFSLRYLALTFHGKLPEDISRLQNLQTIVHRDTSPLKNSCLPNEIWMMPNLLHLHVPPTFLSSPPSESKALALRTLMDVINLSFGIEILDRIKSLKKLSLSYDVNSYVEQQPFKGWSEYKLENLASLKQLEKLKFSVLDFAKTSRAPHPWPLAFPQSVKRLTLSGCRIPWGWLEIVGALPNIEVLKLRNNACRGDKWEPIAGQFGELKSLELQYLDLVSWSADKTHFPRLQCLIVKSCHLLDEIPCGIGDVSTLGRIQLVNCHQCVVASAEKIREEQVRRTGSSNVEVSVS